MGEVFELNEELLGVIRLALRLRLGNAFAGGGLGGVSLRGIATDARVDVALIHHYLHSKEELFLASMQIPVPIHELVAPLVAEGTGGLGERLVRTMLAIWESTYMSRLWHRSAQRSPSQQRPARCRNS